MPIPFAPLLASGDWPPALPPFDRLAFGRSAEPAPSPERKPTVAAAACIRPTNSRSTSRFAMSSIASPAKFNSWHSSAYTPAPALSVAARKRRTPRARSVSLSIKEVSCALLRTGLDLVLACYASCHFTRQAEPDFIRQIVNRFPQLATANAIPAAAVSRRLWSIVRRASHRRRIRRSAIAVPGVSIPSGLLRWVRGSTMGFRLTA